MRVLIANPPWPGEGYGTRTNIRWPHRRGDKVLTFPIYLATALAVLKKNGLDAKGVDAVDKEFGIISFVDYVKKFNPEIILLEVSTPSIMHDLETAFQIKKEVNCLVVLWGPHASYFDKEIIENYKFVDVIIKGELDYTLLELCKNYSKKRGFKDIKGITYREKDKIVINVPRELIENLDELPFADREDFRIERYQQAFYTGRKAALLISTRGCPYRCTFCLWPDTLYGHRFRARSAKNVADEIEFLKRNYNIDEIYFDDDSFLIDKERVKELCNELIRRKINLIWRCMARVNNVDEETLRLMKKAGCKDIFYGFESGSDKILKTSSKGITKEQIINAVNLTKKVGIMASGSFVIGLPEESKETINETIKFARQVHADYVQFTLAAAFPGTKLYEEAKALNLFEYDSWEDFDGCHGAVMKTKYMSKKELNGIIRKMNLRYYSSPRVIFQNVKSIKNLKDIRRISRGVSSIISRIIFYRD
ncbi:MAG: radical SAM protein [Candidatus Nanoarchaeia archaeon]|nr:radical SAM protein [Candidatus Nanoarchaeia archaeon]